MSHTMHKYRSPDGETIRVVTDTSHIALVGPEWRELPAIYHNAAIQAGCECDAPTVKKNAVKPKASPDAAKERTPEEKIEAALKTMLERDEKGDFTGNGEPNLIVVGKLAGLKVKRADVAPIHQRLLDEAEEEEEEEEEGNDE